MKGIISEVERTLQRSAWPQVGVNHYASTILDSGFWLLALSSEIIAVFATDQTTPFLSLAFYTMDVAT